MTIATDRTSSAPTPQEAAPLPAPTPLEVVELQAVRDYPAVSVLCTTQRAPRMAPADALRLSALVGEAEARLAAELGTGPSRLLRERLRALAADAARRSTASAVALYVASATFSAWSLPVPVRDRAIVDPTFATRDLVRSLHRTPRHVVLVLTDREARLFDGSGETLLPAVGGAFPLGRSAQAQRRDRAGRSGRAGRAQRAAATEDADRDAFLRIVDRALGTYLRLHPAPLVLVGARRTVTSFTNLSRNTGRLAGAVYGSHARTPLPALVRLVRPVLERYLRSRQDEALVLLDQRTGAGRVVTGMQAVWLAARVERPEMLAVEHDLFYPARLDLDGDLLTPATDVDHPEVIDDAVDEVIETVLHRGGWVALVDSGALADNGRIALTTRRM